MIRTALLMVTWFMSLALAGNHAHGADELATQAIQLLKSKCVSCHGADQVESGLRLDSRAALLKGGERGAAIVERNPTASLLFQCVTGESGEELRMPPKNPLSQSEIELLKRWLSSGALWPEPEQPEMQAVAATEPLGDAWSDPRNPIVKIFGGERLDLWSLKPISQPVIPATTSTSWCRNEIDHFVAARFEAAQVALPSVADRHTLLRRIHFDLTGLPPSPELAASFESTTADHDVEKLIDQLLHSEQFGIHWARMWLDVARYSDSNGFDWDEFRPQAYRYRDYVIRSFNQDKAYDRFITEQLAGDELLDGPPRSSEQQDALIATGFLRMGPHDNAAKLFNEQDRSRDELLIDLVETTSGAMLGLTMSCCRCHDHKFDPVSQADYFRLRACFAGVQFADDLPIDLEEEQTRAAEHNGAIDESVAKLEAESKELFKSIHERVKQERGSQGQSEEAAEFSEKPEELKKLKKRASEAEKQRLDELEAAIKQANTQRLKLTQAMLIVDEEKPPVTFVLYQGDYKAPRQSVEPGVLSILNPNALRPVPVARPGSSGRRMALANWVSSRDNPLTARVLVNRVWQQLMGQGLVATPGDFGLAGSPPADAALLDWLAQRFMNDGWSIKRLVRTIMLSAAYRQTAAYKEPLESLAYATRRPRRLTAEQLRDSMLAVSGLLTSKNSGPPQWPDLPREVLEANPAFLDDNETKTKGWYPSSPAEQNCRSIFLVQKRNTRVPLLETLDQPENSVPCQRRLASIVAPQALSLLNSPQALTAAKSFASRIRSATESSPEQIKLAFALALQRQPTASELQACERLMERAGLIEICRALLNVNEFAYID